MKVRFLELGAQYLGIKQEIDEALLEVAASGRYVLGPNVERFEAEAAAFCGAGHAVGLASGTDALLLALRACGVKPGEGVITTPFTFVATAEAIARAGARPVFCDVEPEGLNMDPSLLEKTAGEAGGGVSAVMAVHLYGRPAEMDEINASARRFGMKVIEDAAQAFGALYRGRRTGSLGDVSAFSFFPSKSLGAFGDAGMAATSDGGTARRLRLLGNHGLEGAECVEHGFNSRLDEIQAAVLRVKLKFIDRWMEERRKIAQNYSRLLEGLPVRCPSDGKDSKHSFNYYTLQCEDRDGLRRRLSSLGIDTAVYYPVPVHLQEAFKTPGCGPGAFPVAEEAAGKVLSLPVYPGMEAEKQEYVAEGIRSFYAAGR